MTASRVYKYKAFISYRHLDTKEACKLENFLEDFRLPKKLRKENPELPVRLGKIFRDVFFLCPGKKLESQIKSALEESENLIVLCSEHTGPSQEKEEKKRWVDEEVRHFWEGRKDNIKEDKSKIIPLILPLSQKFKEDIKKNEDGTSAIRQAVLPPFLQKILELQELGLQDEILSLDFQSIKENIGCKKAENGETAKLVFKNEEDATRKECYYGVAATLLGIKKDDLWHYVEEAERLRKRARLIRNIIKYSMLLAICVFLWDFCVPKVSYYADYVEHYNLPVGIEPLSEEEVKKRDFVYKFTEQWYRLRQVECCDSQGNLIEENTFDGVNKSVKMKFTYREGLSIEEGGLEKTEHFNKMGGLIKWYEYDEKLKTISFQSVDKENDLVHVNGTTLQKDNPYSLNADVPMVNVKRDENGFVIERRYRDGKKKPLAVEGVYGVRFTRDKLGRVVGKRYLDMNGKVANNKFGVAGINIEYDKLNGNEGESEYVISFVDKNGNLVFHPKYQMAYVKYTMKDGVLESREFFDEKENPCFSFLGYHRVEYYYDFESCKLEKELYVDTNNQLCYDNEGKAGVQYKFYKETGESSFVYLGLKENSCCNNAGITEERIKKEQRGEYEVYIQSFYAHNGMELICHPRWGISIIEYYYDSNGLKVKQVYKNKINERCLDTNEIAEGRFEYDDTNRRLLKETYYGVGEYKRCLNVSNVAGYKYEYKDLADSIEIHKICLDTEDNPCADKDGIAEERYLEDQLGNIKEISYYKLNEKNPCENIPCKGVDKFHKEIHKYNDRGQLIEVAFYDDDGRTLCKNKNEIAKITFNRQEEVEEVRFYDERGNFCLDKNNKVAGENRKYNKRGLVKEVAYVGKNGQASPCKNNYVSVKYEYNARGLKTKESYVGADGKACLHKDGYAGRVFKYDKFSNRLTEIHYFGKNGESCANNDGGVKRVIVYDDLLIGVVVWQEYDSNNKVIMWSFENLIGPDGVSIKSKLIYGADGIIIGERYVDLENKPCVHPIGGQAETRLEYKNGKVSKEWYIGTDGKQCLNRLGHAFVMIEYNDLGQRTKDLYFGLDGKPCLCKYGYAEIRYEYDTQGKKTKESYYDEKGNCIKTIDYTK